MTRKIVVIGLGVALLGLGAWFKGRSSESLQLPPRPPELNAVTYRNAEYMVQIADMFTPLKQKVEAFRAELATRKHKE